MFCAAIFVPYHSLCSSTACMCAPSTVGADVTDYFNYGFTEETWRLYCEKQKRLRGEVASLNKIVVSSLYSREPAWTVKWYSRTTHTVVKLAQVHSHLVGWTCGSIVLAQFSFVMRYHVNCWMLCYAMFVMIKNDFSRGICFYKPSLVDNSPLN